VVDALAERDGEDEVAYLGRCAADPLALRIKRADIADKFVTVDARMHEHRDKQTPLLRHLSVSDAFDQTGP
jgi:hypothetical protein